MDNMIVNNITSQGIDKTAIKIFAVYARNKLIKDIKNKAAMIGVTESGIQEPLSTSTGNIQLFDIGMQEPYYIKGKAIAQRNGLIRELKKREQVSTYLTGYENLIEEVAYTWFNRIIAIRFMEVNNYMPDRMRVLSSGVEGINEPEFITHVFETCFHFSYEEKNKIIELKTGGSNLAMDELFQYLFIKQCNALNANLPELFEKTNDYSELLLTVSYNDIEGVIYKLVHDVPESNFDVNSENGNGQVEIIGWLYQYYNSERKDEVINVLAGKAVKKENIPAATQLFTTDWVVKYMVDNSLGKYWLERNPHSSLANSLEYLVTNNINEVDKKQSPENIKFLDNCMGSGHILVYAFDVLMRIYETEGYNTREAAGLIVENNLYGLEIDKRSYQLSYFAIMMKARQYNRRILDGNLQNNLHVFQDSTYINQEHIKYLGCHLNKYERKQAVRQLDYLIELFNNAEELGSIIIVEEDLNEKLLLKFIEDFNNQGQLSLETIGIEETQQQIKNLVKIAELLKQKYEVVATNPPYMNKYDSELKKYVKEKYKDFSGDLFSVFIYRNTELLVEDGYSAYMSPFVWMFIKSYQKLREYIVNTKYISSLIQMEYSAFEEATVPICTFVLGNTSREKTGNYIKLSDFKGGMEVQKNKTLEAIADLDCGYHFVTSQEYFKSIPSFTIAYWVTEPIYNCFKSTTVKDYGYAGIGMRTGDNDRFLRRWYEVDRNKIGISCSSPHEIIDKEFKWIPYNKGGEFRKWYGNNEYVVNWENNGYEIKENTKKVYPQLGDNLGWKISNESYYFKPGITWSGVTTGDFSCRCYEEGFIFDSGANGLFTEISEERYYIAGFLNSNIGNYLLKLINPTINTGVGTINMLPMIMDNNIKNEVNNTVKENIKLVKTEWDYSEISWDFKKHPLLIYKSQSIKKAWDVHYENISKMFYKLKNNEERLNMLFIDLLNSSNEVDYKVKDKSVSIKIITKKEVIVSFVSYAVGCLFGRYSLVDVEERKTCANLYTNSHYNSENQDKEVIVITEDMDYFEDIASLFIQLVRRTFGENYLDENLRFIADALGNRGSSAIEVIRNYFVKDFYKNHIQLYKKRPIYWLYDSGKQNGFKALVYMHHYDEDTTGKVRVDYLHQVQRAYERTITNLQEDISNSIDAKEVTQLQKRFEKITKQLKECRDYDERLGHMALERIAIDLDVGVKVNYEKVQTDNKGNFHQILAKIK